MMLPEPEVSVWEVTGQVGFVEVKPLSTVRGSG
jgi:hypothetical protein